MESGRRYDKCKFGISRASFKKHLKSTKQEKKSESFPFDFFNETFQIKPRK